MIKKKDSFEEGVIRLGRLEIDPFTGKQFNAIRKLKCDCSCHNDGLMHIMPCCDKNGDVNIPILIEDE